MQAQWDAAESYTVAISFDLSNVSGLSALGI